MTPNHPFMEFLIIHLWRDI